MRRSALLVMVIVAAITLDAEGPKTKSKVAITDEKLVKSASDQAGLNRMKVTIESLRNLIFSDSMPLFVGVAHHVVPGGGSPLIVETQDLGYEESTPSTKPTLGGMVRLVGTNPLTKGIADGGSYSAVEKVQTVQYRFENANGSGVPVDRVSYRDVYPGVSLHYKTEGDSVRLQFEITSDGSVDSIRMELDRQEVDVAFPYSSIDGQHADVFLGSTATPGEFKITTIRPMTKQTISIEMLVSPSARAMNRTSPLGLSGAGYATAVDFLGNSYVVGSASVTGQLGSRAGRDVFLAKVTPTGQVESVTYFGGSGDEEGPFAVVADGFRVLVAGTTRSDDFPMVRKGNVLAGGSDIFVATFSLQGEMTKARIFGGSGDEKLTGFSYDGDLHLVGSTTSSDFPVTPGAFQTKLGGDRDGFYARVSGADQSSLMYATYVGGSTDDVAESVASNKFSSLEGRPYVYIAGKTLSQDFPHTTGDSSRVGGAFVVKLCPDVACAEKPIARVFPGCAASGQGGAITAAGADYSGNVYVVTSAAAGLAVKDSSIQNRNMGGTDLYLVELSRDLDEIKRATYFGGDGDDVPSGVQVDFEGNIFVAGRTVSERFPGTRPPRGIWRGATQHLFVCWFAPDLAKVWFSRFIAVDPTDGSATLPISLDGQRNIYLAGRMNVSSRSPGAPMLEKLSMIADGVSLRVSNPDDGTWPSISSVKESKPGWLSIRGRSFSKRPHIFLGDTIPLSMNVIDDGNVEVELGSKKRDFVISLTSERGHGALAAYPYVPIAVSPQREGAWASALVPPPQVPLHLDRVSFGARQVSVAAMIIVLALLIAGRRTE